MSLSHGARHDAQTPPAEGRPILFLHIPKCAGTSIDSMLNNLFGEASTLRLHLTDPATISREIETALAPHGTKLCCISGHVPYSFFAPHDGKFRLFTMLRHPVARVMSLFRFLRRHPGLQQMGLRPDFTFRDVLASPAGEIFPVLDNAMCRMLCRGAPFHDRAAPERWRLPTHAPYLEDAMATLRENSFGLAERLTESCLLFQRDFAVPFALDPPALNATKPRPDENDAALIDEILERNRLDLALYESCEILFNERLARLRDSDAVKPAGIRSDMVFRPKLDSFAVTPWIAGRQGFYDYSEALSWIAPDAPARLHFVAPASCCRIVLVFYSLEPDYPVDRIVLELQGRPVTFRITRRHGNWFQLQSGPLAMQPGVNCLMIAPPFAVPVQSIRPHSQDERALSVGLATVVFSRRGRPKRPVHPELWPRRKVFFF